MERKRVSGRFAGETEEEKAARRLTGTARDDGKTETEKKPKRVERSLRNARLRYCRKLVSHKLAEAMPSIVDTLVTESKNGSVEHTKELLKLASAEQKKILPEKPKRRDKGFAQRLVAELRSRRPIGPMPKDRGAMDEFENE